MLQRLVMNIKNKIRRVTSKVLLKNNKLCSEQIVWPVYNKKLSKRPRITGAGRQGTLECEINIRAIMAAYYTGTGGFDIGNVADFYEYREVYLGKGRSIIIHLLWPNILL